MKELWKPFSCTWILNDVLTSKEKISGTQSTGECKATSICLHTHTPGSRKNSRKYEVLQGFYTYKNSKILDAGSSMVTSS